MKRYIKSSGAANSLPLEAVNLLRQIADEYGQISRDDIIPYGAYASVTMKKALLQHIKVLNHLMKELGTTSIKEACDADPDVATTCNRICKNILSVVNMEV